MAAVNPKAASTVASELVYRQDRSDLLEQGMTLRAKHRFEDAYDLFSMVRALYPNDPNAAIGLGATCFSEGRFEAAIRHYGEALKLDASNAYAYALLGEAQIFQGEYLQARVSLQRACALDLNGSYSQLARCLLRFLDILPGSDLPRQNRTL